MRQNVAQQRKGHQFCRCNRETVTLHHNSLGILWQGFDVGRFNCHTGVNTGSFSFFCRLFFFQMAVVTVPRFCQQLRRYLQMPSIQVSTVTLLYSSLSCCDLTGLHGIVVLNLIVKFVNSILIFFKQVNLAQHWCPQVEF